MYTVTPHTDSCNYSLCSDIFKTKKFPNNDFILSTNHNISAKFSGETGLLKSVSIGSTEVVLDLDFVSYGTRSGRDKSGAYLFLPDREASSIVSSRKKYKIITIAGPLVRTSLLGRVATPRVMIFIIIQLQEVRSDIGVVKHAVLLTNSLGIDGYSLTIHNTVDVRSESNRVCHKYIICTYVAYLLFTYMCSIYGV